MQNVEAISGFSDLKNQFALTCNFVKPLNELSLWFSELGGDIYVHDYEDHDVCMVIAIYNKRDRKYNVRLKPNSAAFNMIKMTLKLQLNSGNEISVDVRLNSLFKLFGTIPFRLLK